MRKKILTIIFIVLMALCVSLITVFPGDAESVRRENREAAEFPEFNFKTITDGSFMKGMDSYLNDRVGFRGFFTNTSAKIKAMSGINSEFGKVIPVKKDIGTGAAEESYLVYHDYTLMEAYISNNAALDSYIEALNSYTKVFGDSVNMYSMLVPTQLEYEDKLYSSMQDGQKDTIDKVAQELDSRYNVVNVYDALKKNESEYLYFRTDHHWTADGAYEAYKKYCNAAKLTPVDKAAYEKKEYEGMLGSLYDQSQEKEVEKKPDTLIRYITDPDGDVTLTMKAVEKGEKIEYRGTLFNENQDKIKYSAFMGGDHQFAEIKNKNGETDRTLLIFKDSYANAFLPWVVENYKTVIVIDPRSYTGNISEITEEYKIDDFLMFNYVFSTSFSDYCEMLKKLAK